MRSVAVVTAVVLAVSLLGTVQAAEPKRTDRTSDTEGELLDDPTDLLDDQLPFDLLVLPEELRDQARSQLGAALPGPNADLSPNLDLMAYPAVTLDVGDYVSTPSLDLARTQGTTTAMPTTADVVDAADTGAMPTTATTSDATTTDESTSSSDSDATQASSDDEAVSTQSSTAEQASTAEAVREAWNELSPAQKTAVGAAGLLTLLLGPLTMYSRIKRDDALENDTRREIYEIVESNPGVCIKDVADQADVSYSTASYHLDRLLRMDYVARREEGNRVLYYKNGGSFNNEERELVPILKNEEAMRVFQHILENPWCYRAEVAEALGVSHTTVNWHLKRLQGADLVEEHREGRSCHLHIPEDALDRVVDVLDKLEQLGVDEAYAEVPQPVPA